MITSQIAFAVFAVLGMSTCSSTGDNNQIHLPELESLSRDNSDGGMELNAADTEKSKMEKAQAVIQDKTIHYWIYTPSNASDNMPLIVYLHGGSSKGNNLDLLVQNEGFPQYVQQNQLTIPAYVIMPQVSQDTRFWNEASDNVIQLIEYVADQYHIDKTHISLTGHSMGGIGTWEIAHDHMNMFFRIAPLSGTISKKLQPDIADFTLPIWAFVGDGASDSNAYQSNTSTFPNLTQHNTDARLTIIENAEHRETVRAYLQYGVIDWLTGAE